MRWLLIITMAGCAASGPAPGPVAQSVEAAADANGLPRDLVLAIAQIEGGLWLAPIRILRPDDDVPVAGALELRHGAFNSLARGAQLMGTDEATLRIDTELGTLAGARVLAELAAATGAQKNDLASYQAALEELSGYRDGPARTDYAARVLAVVRDGGIFPARGGEQVRIAAHPEVAPPSLGVRQEAASTTPDYPGATWYTTDCTNKCTAGRPDGNAAVNTIVIHDTEGGWDASVSTLQFDSGKSVHYLVDADGSRVAQFVKETDTAWHAGNWPYNVHSVGIEHVGFAADKAGYADGEYDTSVKLVKNIRTRWTVPLDRTHIVGHYQIPDGDLIAADGPPCTDTLDACETGADWGGASNHRDPGYYWQWCQYMEKLGGSCTCNDAYSLWNCTTDHTEAVRCTGGKVQIDHCTAGCTSEPVGTDDVCAHAAPDGGAGETWGSVYSGPPSETGNGGAGGAGGSGGGGGGGVTAHSTSGCSISGVTTGGGNLFFFSALAAGLALRTRARRLYEKFRARHRADRR